MASLIIIDEATVREALTMDAAIAAMGTALRAHSQGETHVPARITSQSPEGSGSLLVMPGSASCLTSYGAKLVSLHPENKSRGKPVIQGLVVLFDTETGAPQAIIEASLLTAIRTAAASAYATDVLARKNVKTHVILGAGVQAKSHAEAIAHVRPSLEQTLVWARDEQRSAALAGELKSSLGMDIRSVQNQDIVAKADIISSVTASQTPIIEGVNIAAGSHINLVGSHTPTHREADTETILRSRVFVDSMDGAMKEAGDILIPIEEGAFAGADIIGEIGTVGESGSTGRTSDLDITLYKSLGNAAQDIYVANLVFTFARDKGLGHTVRI